MSIPRVIHYCWLSDDPLPPKLAACVASWHEKCPDYEIINWNFERLGDVCPPWVHQAFEARKYAFAADWVRAYVLYNFGGIYLDSDVEIVRPFDDLLHNRYVFSFEHHAEEFMEAAVLLAEPGMPFFRDLLAYYHGRNFMKPDGTPDTYPLPMIITDICRDRYRFVSVADPQELTRRQKEATPDEADRDLLILPSEYFSPKSAKDYRVYATERTYAIHHFEGTWLPRRERLMRKLKAAFPGLRRLLRSLLRR